MKKLLPLAIIVVVVALLAGCSAIYSLIPSLDPLVGSWTLSKILIPSSMDGSGTWEKPSTLGMSGSMTVNSDNSLKGTWTMKETTQNMKGTWQNNSGVYTIVLDSDTVAAMATATLSSDNKTVYVSVNNGICEELTKD